MTLLDQISQVLGASDNVSSLMGGLRTTEADTRSLLGAGVPAVLAGLGQQAGGGGAAALHALVSDDGGGLFDRIGDFFGVGDQSGRASGLVDSVFGGQRGAIESHVSGQSGLDLSVVSRFLPMVAPAVMSLLGRIGSDAGHDAEGLSAELAVIGADGPLGDIIAASSDDDRSGFVDGIASLREAGGLASLLPSGITTAAATAGAGAAAGTALHHQADEEEAWIGRPGRSGLAWLAPVLALLGLLILGLVLWQCSNSGIYQASIDTVDDHGEDAEMAADADDGAHEEEAAAPDPEPTATPVPEPTTTPVPEPTATPVPQPVSLVDLAIANPDISTTLGMAAGFAGQLGDADGGPYTVFAPSNAAVEGAEGFVGRLDDAQLAATLGFHIVEGVVEPGDLIAGAEFPTLTGEPLRIAADGELPGGWTIAGDGQTADNGVLYVIDGVMVPGSVSRGLVTQDINALFALEPIQFAVSSAEILPESVPTLDNAVEVLVNAPANTVLEVGGHTDSDGSAELNQALSEARANSVVEYLTANGVNPDMLVPVGYGETDLAVDPEVTPEDKFTNRRIEFTDITGG